jgi:AraC family transcriptional regulator
MSEIQAWKVAPLPRLAKLLGTAVRCFQSNRETALRCLQNASVLLLGEFGVAEEACNVRPVSQRGGLAPWQVKLMTAHIETHLDSRIVVGELAGLVKLSESHFSRAFSVSLGTSPGQYIAAQRVARAKLMMASTRESLAHIAIACGFSDQPHLSKSFRCRVGVTPGAWRRLNGPLPSVEMPESSMATSASVP